MKLKLNQILAAALVAAASVPAMAAIAGPGTGNGELFLVIWDSVDKVSYTKDLGIRMDSFNGNADLSFAISDQYFSGFLGIAATTVANFSDLKYAVLAGDSTIFGGKRTFATIDVGTPTTPLTNQQLTNQQGYLNTYTNAQSSTANGNHTADIAFNGSSYSVSGDAYFLPNGPTMTIGTWSNSNLIGTSAVFRSFSGPGNTGISPTVKSDFAGLWNVTQNNGAWTAAYNVAAIPEADGIVMALAGFGALGFLSLRRRQG